MRNSSLLAVLMSAITCCAAHAAGAPTQQQVQDWWKAKSSEALTIEGPLQEVHLMDKEVAYIAPVRPLRARPKFHLAFRSCSPRSARGA